MSKRVDYGTSILDENDALSCGLFDLGDIRGRWIPLTLRNPRFRTKLRSGLTNAAASVDWRTNEKVVALDPTTLELQPHTSTELKTAGIDVDVLASYNRELE